MKVDLNELERRAMFDLQWHGGSEYMSGVLALVRVARAAKEVADSAVVPNYTCVINLRAALSDIEDSKHG